MDEKVTQSSPAPTPSHSETAAVAPPRRRGFRASYVVVPLLLLALVAYGVWYYRRNLAPYETTDDAFITGYVTFVSPRVSGPVTRLLVADNQRVKAGDPVLEIDPRDFQTLVDQADADLAVAKSRIALAESQIPVDQAKADQQSAAITAAQAASDRAAADLQRYQSAETQSVSRSQLDLAKAQSKSTMAEVEVARNQARAAVGQVEIDRANLAIAQAQVKQAETRLEQAQLQLSYTKIAAPRDGRVTRRTVEQGAYVQTGQALLALVPDDLWVVANFKETQLEQMQPGQPVTLKVDAYPHHEFKGKVDSLQAGSGAVFSLLPPENAVGNYVKVVQRVPVKILFDEPVDLNQYHLAPGLSVEPKVRIK